MTDAPRLTGTCTRQLHDGPLTCTRPAGHPPGCTYEATGAPDAHDTTEAAAERSRG